MCWIEDAQDGGGVGWVGLGRVGVCWGAVCKAVCAVQFCSRGCGNIFTYASSKLQLLL